MMQKYTIVSAKVPVYKVVPLLINKSAINKYRNFLTCIKKNRSQTNRLTFKANSIY